MNFSFVLTVKKRCTFTMNGTMTLTFVLIVTSTSLPIKGEEENGKEE